MINILDNHRFKNPVNQRGVSGTISEKGYFIDRWKLVDGEVTIEEDGLRLNGTIEQILENRVNDIVTASVLSKNGIASSCFGSDAISNASILKDNKIINFDYNDTSKTLQISANDVLIEGAKLELGRKQTLAHQELGVWKFNDPQPNFEQELEKCRYYQIVLNSTGHAYAMVGSGFAYSATRVLCYIHVGPHRIDPLNPTVYGKWCVTKNGATDQDLSVDSLTLSKSNDSDDYVMLYANLSGGAVIGQPYWLRANSDATARIILDYNL